MKNTDLPPKLIGGKIRISLALAYEWSQIERYAISINLSINGARTVSLTSSYAALH